MCDDKFTYFLSFLAVFKNISDQSLLRVFYKQQILQEIVCTSTTTKINIPLDYQNDIQFRFVSNDGNTCHFFCIGITKVLKEQQASKDKLYLLFTKSSGLKRVDEMAHLPYTGSQFGEDIINFRREKKILHTNDTLSYKSKFRKLILPASDKKINVIIYGKPKCSYCSKAVDLCKKRGIKYTYKSLDTDYTQQELLEQFPNAKIFPQIKIQNEYINGYEELEFYLLVSGHLDSVENEFWINDDDEKVYVLVAANYISKFKKGIACFYKIKIGVRTFPVCNIFSDIFLDVEKNSVKLIKSNKHIKTIASDSLLGFKKVSNETDYLNFVHNALFMFPAVILHSHENIT